MNSEKKLVTIPQAQALLSVSRGTIYRWLGDGRLKALKFGRKCVRIDVAEIDAMLAATPHAKIAPPTS